MTDTTKKQAPRRKVQTPKANPAKAAAPKTKTAKTKAAKAPVVNTHVEAGIDIGRYTGPSKFVNGNRKVKIMKGREVANLTDRAQKGLYALRDCYSDKAFQPKGFDNGILRDLLGAGLIKLSGGQEQTIDGTAYVVDGATPVKVSLTAAGLAYGKA